MPQRLHKEEDATDLDKITPSLSKQMGQTSKENDAGSSAETQDPEMAAVEQTQSTGTPHTILTEKEKIFTIMMASFAAFIAPVSGSIYYPALNSLASDLHVTMSTINLTITVYLIFEAIAPIFIGNISDNHGRRPAYLFCLLLYMCANIGLALQTNYKALMILRCLQSSGSSGTIALGGAVAADIITRAERGKYVGYAAMGAFLGPALGPIIGGLLDRFLGWRSIFWFLTIFTGTVILLMITCFPETSRRVVGNGSIPAQKWNVSILDLIRRRSSSSPREIPTSALHTRRLSPLDSLRIAFQKEASLIIFFAALLYAGFSSTLSSLPSQLFQKYAFNSLQIGLCYLPYGVGSLTSRWTAGTLLDWNFRRHARRLGIPIIPNRQQKLSTFPIERARLQIMLPFLYLSCVALAAYGWVMEFGTSLAGPLTLLFFLGHAVTCASSSLNTLVVDCNVESPATAIAALNLFRCLFGAGAVAAVVPLIERIGMGWTCSLFASVWVIFSPILWAVMRWGHGWRKEKTVKDEETAAEKENQRGAATDQVIENASDIKD